VITAIDTNILIDVFGADPTYGEQSKEALRSSIQQGSLIACDVVWAEVISLFPTGPMAQEALTGIGVGYSPLEAEASMTAGQLWKIYRDKGGKRTRMVADFLIGAHALHQADVLLTRDRGFYRLGIPSLKIIDPSRQKKP
jgi:predicted nucleic acid-binding protein